MYFNRSISTLLFAAVFFSFAAGEDESFLYVDAKIRVFHTKDGRKYNDYRRQETLTVDQLKGYRSKPDRLSRYGGLAESNIGRPVFTASKRSTVVGGLSIQTGIVLSRKPLTVSTSAIAKKVKRHLQRSLGVSKIGLANH